jgi:adenylate cyclase
MAPCITREGGAVDKFLTQGGVVIMAFWGVLENFSSPERNAISSIRASLNMREALKEFNKQYADEYGPTKMGSAINTGSMVAGQIGGSDRMEYTIVGDTVNLAARMEGPNDLFDTDILISENTLRLAGRTVIVEEMPGLEIKGKDDVLRVFAVINMRGEEGPKNLDEVREGWTA